MFYRGLKFWRYENQQLRQGVEYVDFWYQELPSFFIESWLYQRFKWIIILGIWNRRFNAKYSGCRKYLPLTRIAYFTL